MTSHLLTQDARLRLLTRLLRMAHSSSTDCVLFMGYMGILAENFHWESNHRFPQIPPTAVGGLFKLNPPTRAAACFPNSTNAEAV